MPEPLTFRLFGRFEARRGVQPLVGLHLREGERLLAYLLMRGGEPVTTRDIARLFWPAEASANVEGGDFPSVRQSLRTLRTALGEDAERLTRAARGMVQFDVDGLTVDFLEFNRLTQAATDPGGAAAERAVAHYRGPLLAEWRDAWVVDARQRLHRRYEHALRRLAALAHDDDDAEREERWLRLHLLQNPSDEGSGRALLRLLLTAGRLADMQASLGDLTDAIRTAKRQPEPETLRIAEELRQAREAAEFARHRPVLSPTTPEPKMAAAVHSPGGIILEAVGGAVPIDSPFYIERPDDALFHAALRRQDSIVLLKGARQVGKTSLLARGLQAARERGARVVLIDFQKFNAAQLATADTFYTAMASMIAHKLGLSFSAQDMQDEDAGPNWRMEQFVLRGLLPQFSEPLIWAMDEVDRLFGCPFSSEIFGLFRSWHNERALDPSSEFSRLTLAMAYATEAQLFITDLNQSPFNVGTRLNLSDFTPDQIAELNRRHGAPLNPDALRRFSALLGGQPYLVRQGLYEATQGTAAEALLASADSDGGVFGDHLRRLWASLTRSPELLSTVRALLADRTQPSPEAFYRLRAAGILRGASSQDAEFRCLLYEIYFRRQIAAAH